MNDPFRRQVAAGLEMRLLDPREAEPVFAVVNRNRAGLREWLPWVDATRSAADVAEFARRCQIQWDAGQGPQCGIWLGSGFAGSLGVHPIDWSNRSCSIGYWLDAGARGSGLMGRCCTSILGYLFDELRLHRVEIRCGAGNRKSCAIPQRLGFTQEGLFRDAQWVNDRWVDMLVFSMLQSDWGAAGTPSISPGA